MSTEPNPESPRIKGIGEIKDIIRKSLLTKQGSGTFSPSARRPSVDSPLSVKLKNPDEKPTTDILLRLLMRKEKPDEIGQFLYRSFREHKFFRNLAKSYNHIEEDEAFSHIMKSSTLEVFAPNQLIYKEGDMPNGKIYLILFGEVDLYKRTNKTPKTNQNLAVVTPRSRRMSNASSFGARSEIVLENDDDDRSDISEDLPQDTLFLTKENHHKHSSGHLTTHRTGESGHSRRPSFSVHESPNKSKFAQGASPDGHRKSFLAPQAMPSPIPISNQENFSTNNSKIEIPKITIPTESHSPIKIAIPTINIPTNTEPQNTAPSLSARKSFLVPNLLIPGSIKDTHVQNESPSKPSIVIPTLNIPNTLTTPNNDQPRKSINISIPGMLPLSSVRESDANGQPRKSFTGNIPGLVPPNTADSGPLDQPRKSIVIPGLQIPDAIRNLLPGGQRKSILMTEEGGTVRRKSFLGSDNEIKLSTGRKAHNDVIVQYYDQYGELEEKKLKDDYFGDRILGKDKKRTETAIASCRTELVVLKKHAFEALEKKFNKMKMQFKAHMMKHFPSVGDYSSKTFLETLFLMTEDVVFVRDTHVVKEGQTGDYVYSLVEGTCEIYKQITVEEQSETKGDFEKLGNLYRHSKGRVLDIPYAKIEKGAFIGEEILVEGCDKYQYTVRVISSSATFLRVLKTSLLSSFPKECPQGIITAFNFKKQNHKMALYKILSLKGMSCPHDDLTKVGIIRVKKGEQGDLLNYSPNQHHKEKMKRDITPLVITHESVEFKLDIKSTGPTIMSPKKVSRSLSKRFEDDSPHLTSEPSSPARSPRHKGGASPRISPSPSPTYNPTRKKSSFFTLTAHPVATEPGFEHTTESKEASSPLKRGESGTMSRHFEVSEANSPIPEVSTPSVYDKTRHGPIRPRPVTTESSFSARKNGLYDVQPPIPKSLFCTSTKKENEGIIDINSFVSPRKSQARIPSESPNHSSAAKETPTKPIPIRFQHIPKLAHFDNFIDKMAQLKKYNPKESTAEINSLAANLKAMTGLTPKQEQKLVRTRDMLMKHRMGKAYPRLTRANTESLGDFAEKRMKEKHFKHLAQEEQQGDFLIISVPMSIAIQPKTVRNASPRVIKIAERVQTARNGPIKPILTNSHTTTYTHTRSQSGVESVTITNENADSKTGSSRISPSWSTRPNSYLELDTPTKPKSLKAQPVILMKKVGGFATRAAPSNYPTTKESTLEAVKEVTPKTPKTPKKVIRRVKSAHIFVQNGFSANHNSLT